MSSHTSAHASLGAHKRLIQAQIQAYIQVVGHIEVLEHTQAWEHMCALLPRANIGYEHFWPSHH